MKNIILFRFAGSNKEILRSVSTQMEVDNVLVYKSKQTGNWYQWERNSSGRPVALSNEERDELLSNSENKIINWGNHILHDQPNIIANKPSACKLSSNKWHARKIWQENNIKTPLSSNNMADMITFPFIGRPNHHARQSEFRVVNNIQEFLELLDYKRDSMEPWYYQKIVPKTCEFRVYVTTAPSSLDSSGRIGDKVATIFWKGSGNQLLSSNQEWHWLDDVNWNPDKLPPVFSQYDMYQQQAIEQLKLDIKLIKEECIKATKVLGLDYSGIDVGLQVNFGGAGEFNLFESNTDPELTQLPQRKFAQYFDKVFRGE